MRNITNCIVIILCLFGCRGNAGNRQKAETKPGKIEEQKINKENKIEMSRYSNKFYNDEDFKKVDLIIKNTVQGYKYVENIWKDTCFLCFDDNEEVVTFLKINSNKLFIVTRKDTISNIYDMDLNGNILFKKQLDRVNNLYFNDFVLNNNKIYFKSTTRTFNEKIWFYNPVNTSVKELSGIVDSNNFFKSLKSHNNTSPDGSLTVKIDYGDMFLINNNTGSEENFIKIYTDSFGTDWCFNNVCWNDNGDKFYFDNSGEIACIWEVDLTNLTIDKIVPEHSAESPVYMDNSVFYIEKGCIRKTAFQNYGKEKIVSGNFDFDTLTYNSLSHSHYYIADIKGFPDDLLLANTNKANIAVNADGGVYKVKFLYSLNDSFFIETTSLTMLYDKYKCPKPLPFYSDGLIQYECDCDDGYNYGEKFKVDNYKLHYEESYEYKRINK